MARSDRQLRLLLWVFGGICVIALVPMVMPWRWMAIIHERWLAMGPLPHQPIIEYLARATSALCAFYGMLLLVLARDVRRYSAVITYQAVAMIGIATVGSLLAYQAGMPLWWVLSDFFGCTTCCGAMLVLQWRGRRLT